MESIILTEKNFSKLKELVKQYNEKKIIFYSDDDDLNRKVMEKLPIKVFFGLLSYTSLTSRFCPPS